MDFRFVGRLKLLFYYYFTGLPFDILLALGMTAGVASLFQEFSSQPEFMTFQFLFNFFLINLAVFGTFGGVIIYNRFRRHEYFLFYNKGLVLWQLILFSFISNVLLAVLLSIIISIMFAGV